MMNQIMNHLVQQFHLLKIRKKRKKKRMKLKIIMKGN
jgi:hypothetical protein